MKRRAFLASCACMAGVCALYVSGKKGYKNNIASKGLKYIEVSICDSCNLNCKYCFHFAPVADKVFYDLKKYEQDIRRLCQITKGNIETIRIMGGEPLLNPDVCSYLEITRKYFRFSEICLVTNGILLPSQKEDFWLNLKRNNITIDPSIYNIDVNWKPLFEKFSEYGLNVSKKTYRYISDNVRKSYIKEFTKVSLDLSGTQKDLMMCNNCIGGKCVNLLDGKLYVCPIVSNIKYFNKKFNKNIEISKGDYLDLYKISKIEDIINWQNSPKPFCKYCTPTTTVPWESAKEHTIDEWA